MILVKPEELNKGLISVSSQDGLTQAGFTIPPKITKKLDKICENSSQGIGYWTKIKTVMLP